MYRDHRDGGALRALAHWRTASRYSNKVYLIQTRTQSHCNRPEQNEWSEYSESLLWCTNDVLRNCAPPRGIGPGERHGSLSVVLHFHICTFFRNTGCIFCSILIHQKIPVGKALRLHKSISSVSFPEKKEIIYKISRLITYHEPELRSSIVIKLCLIRAIQRY